jgi:NAD(P)-dependent dehydrogenase (short-subunit alcohol dehydrogenase family)
MFLDIDYAVIITQQLSRTASVKICDGSRTLIKADFALAEGGLVEAPWEELREPTREIPPDRGEKELKVGAIAKGEYSPDRAALAKLLSRFGIDERAFGRLQLSSLLWSSYLVGMEQPGLRSLFHKLTLAFENLEGCHTLRLSYEAKVISLNAFGSVRSKLQLFSGDRLAATGEIRAFVVPENRNGSVGALSALLHESDKLKGKVALVVGASRGLGAMLAAALALQGCTVIANFNHSESEARRLQEALAGASGRVVLAKGDAANLAWCEELKTLISHEFDRLDFLVCSACPSLLSLRLEPNMVARINSYVGNALALVSVPLSVFLRLLAEKSGWSVVISSAAVETTPVEWPHYVAVKCGIEGLVRVAGLQYPNARFLLVRPSRLVTDLTSGPSAPFGQGDIMLPEVAAAKIVKRLLDTPVCQQVEVFTP